MTDKPASVVGVERHGAVLVITIDRPAQRNAVNRAVSLGIAGALDRLDGEADLRVGIITGGGGHFCAGMDLKAFVDGERPELAGRGFAGLTEAPPAKPLIAAVEGYALAGGFELALACDAIVASEEAVFGLPEVALGLVAGSGGLIRLPQRIPPNIALEYVLTGAHLPAPVAHRWGLVNRLARPGAALAGALALAEAMAANAPLALTMSKRIMREAKDWPADDIWERQRRLADVVINSEDAKEGARAFLEKRAPHWAGR